MSKVVNSPKAYKVDTPPKKKVTFQDIPKQATPPQTTVAKKTFKPIVFDTEVIYSVGQNCYLRVNSMFVLLQKRMTSLKLTFEQLVHLQELYPAINSTISEFKQNKEVKYFQDLEDDVYIGIQSPYSCVDIRKFWRVTETQQLHPTKVGIPLTFLEFEIFMKIVRFLQEE